MLELTLYESARKVLINPDHIVAIFRDSDKGDVYTAVDTVTTQYCVSEKPEYLMEQL